MGGAEGGGEEPENICSLLDVFDPLLLLGPNAPLRWLLCSIHSVSKQMAEENSAPCIMLGLLWGRDGGEDCSRGDDVSPFTPLCLLYSFLSASGPLYVLGPNLSVTPLTTALSSGLNASCCLSCSTQCAL